MPRFGMVEARWARSTPMTVHDQILIYAAYRISPEMGQACEDVIRSEKPTRRQRDRLYKLIRKQEGNRRIPRDIYVGLIEAVRPRHKD